MASVEGEEVRSAPFTISERLLTFRAALVSNAESIADHQGVNATLNLTVSPPLDALPDEEILSIVPADPSAPVTASVSGPVYGDGGTLYLPVRLEAGVLPADLSDLSSLSYLVTLRGVLGEQLPFYDPLTVQLSLPIRR